MNRKTLALVAGAVAVIGVAWAGGTWLVGQQIEAELKAQTDKLTDQLPSLKITEQKYEKGFFASTRTTTVQVGCEAPAGAAGAPSGPITLTVRDRILHGPVPGGRALGLALVETELVLPDEVQAKVAKLFGDVKPLEIRTLIGLGGGYSTDVTSPAFELDGEKGEHYAWKGLDGTVSGDGGMTEVEYDLTAPGFEVTDPKDGLKVTLRDVRMRGETHAVNGSIWVSTGKGNGELGALEVRATGKEGEPAKDKVELSLRDVRFASDTSVQDELLTSKTTVTGTGSVGDLKLDKVELETSLKRVYVPSYQKLLSAIMGASCDAQGKAQPPEQVLGALQQDLVQLFARSPEYAVDRLTVELDGKRGDLSYALGLQGVTDADAETPAMLLISTKGAITADARLPVDWIQRLSTAVAAQAKQPAPPPEQVNGMLDQLAAQGFVERDGEYVKSNLKFAQGALVVNGKPVPLGNGQ